MTLTILSVAYPLANSATCRTIFLWLQAGSRGRVATFSYHHNM
jgi:hypothetical protein